MFTMKPNTVVLTVFKNYCLETDQNLLWVYSTDMTYIRVHTVQTKDTVCIFLYIQCISCFGTYYIKIQNHKRHLRWIKLQKSDLRLLCFWFCFLNYLFPFPTLAPSKFTALIIEEKNKLLSYMAPIIRDIRIALVI